MGPEGLRKDSASVAVTTERGGASVERGRGVLLQSGQPVVKPSLSLEGFFPSLGQKTML